MINNRLSDIELYGGNIFKRKAYELAMKYISSFEMAIIDALKGSRYTAPSTFEHTKSLVKGVICLLYTSLLMKMILNIQIKNLKIVIKNI